MIRRALRGLRGRLLLAFVATSAVTLAVAAAITLSPLQERLRDESATALQDAAEDMRPEFNNALAKTGANKATSRGLRDEDRDAATSAPATLFAPGVRPAPAHRRRARARRRPRVHEPARRGAGVPLRHRLPGATRAARSRSPTARRARTRPRCSSTTTSCGSRCRSTTSGELAGVLVAERSLTEVTTAVKLVRNALFTAAAVGLAVAIGLGLALSSTLTRRLGRLQRSALRITAEGPEAPAPTDRGRDEVGDLARALGAHAGGAAPPGGGAPGVRLHRLARAAHAADDAPGHDGAARRGPARRRRPRTTPRSRSRAPGASCGGCPCWPASCSTSRASMPTCSCARSRSSWARSRAPSPPSSRCAPPSATSTSTSSPTERPCWARADPAACARVVRILIDNALRYAPPRPADRDHRDARPRPGRVRVSDHGPGVPVEEREHIFERFHRGKATSVESGFGLGLAIGRELAERMGGTLAARRLRARRLLRAHAAR